MSGGLCHAMFGEPDHNGAYPVCMDLAGHDGEHCNAFLMGAPAHE